MRILLFFCLTINIFLGLQNGGNAQDVIKSAPEITFKFISHDFGEVLQGEAKTIEFQFQNTGAEPLIISNVLTSCGCTASDWPKSPVLPGQDATINITFDSTGKVGQQKKVITVVSNAIEIRKQLTIEAFVLPRRSSF